MYLIVPFEEVVVNMVAGELLEKWLTGGALKCLGVRTAGHED